MQTDYSGLSSFLSNPILNTDSYKASHFLQYPPDANAMFSYVESRGGRYARTVFFGLQMLLKQYLCKPIDDAMIDEAKAFYAVHGEPFNEAGWRYIVTQYGGYLPVRIRAVVHDVLRHRIGITYEAEAENITSVDIINKIVNEVEVP